MHNVLTIAGSDSSGGAGIQADIKVISALGCYAASVITALTAQNTLGVQSIEKTSPAFVAEQLHSVFSDIVFDAVKIGMVHNVETIGVIAEAIKQFKPKNIVIDPVMISKNGCSLLERNTLACIQNRLLPYAHLITPNIQEAEYILDTKITHFHDMENAAIQLGKKFKTNILVKGGHLHHALSSDVLHQYNKNQLDWFREDRINTSNTHGTGCTYSSAIAANLAHGKNLLDAIIAAKSYVSLAIYYGKNQRLGHGIGPVDHFYLHREKST
jgi:hydroxymethylpyrimidine/phosphomethylpyrimidine kinase